MSTLYPLASAALVDALTLSHDVDTYGTPDARRAMADLIEELRTLKLWARTHDGPAESGLWNAARYGYISTDTADNLADITAGGCPQRCVWNAFLAASAARS